MDVYEKLGSSDLKELGSFLMNSEKIPQMLGVFSLLYILFQQYE